MVGDDEKALSWDEVSDPTHVDSVVEPAPKSVEPASPSVEPAAAVVEPVETPAKPATGSFLLVSYGILGGVVLLYTVGWLLGIRDVVFVSRDTLSAVASTIAQVLAIAAPAIWFGGSFVLTRAAKPIVRLLVLLLGLVATIPLPFILLGASS